jgi:tripartite-type tricarboxylate transporter receptor subunit TctC
MSKMLVAALACMLAVLGPAVAQDWPTRPLTVVVPFAAGGPIDVVGRLISPRMSELLGQQVVVDNTPGAGGIGGREPRRKVGSRRLHDVDR